jgi:uncharacterized spore protein YtfJ
MPNIDELLAGARDALTVRRVYGEPIEQEDVTLIPVAAIRGGGGGGGDSEGNGGGGFGVSARPVGAYVIRDGEVDWRPAVDANRNVLGWQLVSGLALLAAWAVGRRLARR